MGDGLVACRGVCSAGRREGGGKRWLRWRGRRRLLEAPLHHCLRYVGGKNVAAALVIEKKIDTTGLKMDLNSSVD